ncbi:MAG TPA: hypothetical protein PKL83_05595, partial [bacterium]|nr:hypothetical protein [bacterium]
MFWISIILGLLVALGWGIGDMASKKVVDANGPFAPMLALQLGVSLPVLAVWLVSGYALTYIPSAWIWAGVATLCMNI